MNHVEGEAPEAPTVEPVAWIEPRILAELTALFRDHAGTQRWARVLLAAERDYHGCVPLYAGKPPIAELSAASNSIKAER